MYKRCLVAVAHPDDETLGCGGFIRKLSKSGAETMVLTMTDGVSSRSGTNETQKKQRKKSFHTALNLLGVARQQQFDLPDNRLDTIPLLEISKIIEAAVADFRPQIIITHSDADLNQDHRVVSEATKIAGRPQPGNGIKLFWQQRYYHQHIGVGVKTRVLLQITLLILQRCWTLKLRLARHMMQK